jgi:hypothetical protein
MIITSYLLSNLINILTPLRLKTYIYTRAIKNNDFERLVWRAFRKTVPISLSLASGKEYVGWVIRTINPKIERNEIRILPLFSGYRDPKTKKVNYITKYEDVYYEMMEHIEKPNKSSNKDAKSDKNDYDLSHLEIGDFEVIIPTREIIVSRLFDVNAYAHFKKK